MSSYKKIFHIFNRKEKSKFIWLAFALLLTGLLEVVGIASILPFMQLIATPNAIEMNKWLSAIYTFFSFESHRQMLIYSGVGIMILIAFSNLFSIFTTWLQYKYSWGVAHNLSTRLLATYINKPYDFFIKTNTTQLRAYIISEVNSLTGGVIIPVIEIFSRAFVSLVIFGLLLKVDTQIALVMCCTLGGAYTLIYLAQKNLLKQIGNHRINMNLLRFQSLQELLDGIKTVMVYNKQRFFYTRYKHASKEFCEVQPKYNLMLAAPRNILEILAFCSILGITIYLFIKFQSIEAAIPRLSLYAVAGYRLLPALQKVFAAVAKLRHNLPVLDRLYDDLVKNVDDVETPSLHLPPFHFKEVIELDHVNFEYDNSERKVIDDFNLSISAGETVAFIGSTGSGKTTVVDLIVGLLAPTSGKIYVDQVPLNETNIKGWRNNLAYVPQEVFLFDDTVLRNIVFGSPEKEVDFKRLKEITKIVDIYDFITEELPEQFETEIGEKGVRLSGGQRQRLGLARALYAQPKVLVLDEATSALDTITEKGIIESLKRLPKDITIIIIAHRLSTVRHADHIYILEDGKIKDQGTYDSLMDSSNTFKTMVELS